MKGTDDLWKYDLDGRMKYFKKGQKHRVRIENQWRKGQSDLDPKWHDEIYHFNEQTEEQSPEKAQKSLKAYLESTNQEENPFEFLVSKQGHVWISKIHLNKAIIKQEVWDREEKQDIIARVEIPKFIFGFICANKRRMQEKPFKPKFYDIPILKNGFDERDPSYIRKLTYYSNIATMPSSEKVDIIQIIGHDDQPLHGNLDQMFNGARTKRIELKNLNTKFIVSMWMTFACITSKVQINLSDLDVSNVRIMDEMFKDTNLKHLNENELQGWNTENLRSARYLFENQEFRKINLSNWNTAELRDATGMFEMTLKTDEINLEGWNIKNLESTKDMFKSCGAWLINIKGWKTSGIKNMRGMFAHCDALTTILMDPTLRIDNTCDIRNTFESCMRLRKLDLRAWSLRNYPKVFNMFQFCSVTTEFIIHPDEKELQRQLEFDLRFRN